MLKAFTTNETKFIAIPLAPVRCDKFRIKLIGTGRCTVEALTRTFRERSDR